MVHTSVTIRKDVSLCANSNYFMHSIAREIRNYEERNRLGWRYRFPKNDYGTRRKTSQTYERSRILSRGDPFQQLIIGGRKRFDVRSEIIFRVGHDIPKKYERRPDHEISCPSDERWRFRDRDSASNHPRDCVLAEFVEFGRDSTII